MIRTQLMSTRGDIFKYEVIKIGLDHKRYSEMKEIFFGMSGTMASIDEKMNVSIDANDLESKSSASV